MKTYKEFLEFIEECDNPVYFCLHYLDDKSREYEHSQLVRKLTEVIQELLTS